MESMEVFMGTPNERVVAGATRMPPRRWSGMKPIFDGVYINQILFRAGTISVATLAPNEFSPSDARPGSPAPFVRSLNGPLKSS